MPDSASPLPQRIAEDSEFALAERCRDAALAVRKIKWEGFPLPCAPQQIHSVRLTQGM